MEETMAQKVVLIDDLDGSEGEETLHYTVDGQDYEIDLSEKNADRFRKALAPFIQKSRAVEALSTTVVLPTSRRTTRRQTATSGRTDLAQVREWAESKGIQVAPRGRIKQEVYDQYDAEKASGGRPLTNRTSTDIPQAPESTAG
jgi:Lsr2